MVVGQIAQEKEVIVIGGGPAGYTAAIRAAQLGKEVTLIEQEKMGGICLNRGCIPSKVFAYASRKLNEIATMKNFGIEINHYHFSFEALLNQKEKVVSLLRKGVESLFKANKIEIINGKASFLSEDRIGVESGDSFSVYTFHSAIIATGSSPVKIEAAPVNHVTIVDDYSLYHLKDVPDHLAIYGFNYIALEAAFSYRALGSEITVILNNEYDSIALDQSIEKELFRIMKKAKIKVLKEMELVKAEPHDGRVNIKLKAANGEEATIEASHLYIQSEYSPNNKDLGIDRINMATDEYGWIKINKQCETSVKGVYAAGDVTGGEQLAVKAIKQGKVAAEMICGQNPEWDMTYLPKIVYSQPPIASVGLTEQNAAQAKINFKIGQFQLVGNGYSSIMGKRDGFIKVISEKETDRLLGIHIMGEGAIELISAGIAALEMAARIEDLNFPLYPHPSLNEGLLEAVEDLMGLAIHKAPETPLIKNE